MLPAALNKEPAPAIFVSKDQHQIYNLCKTRTVPMRHLDLRLRSCGSCLRPGKIRTVPAHHHAASGAARAHTRVPAGAVYVYLGPSCTFTEDPHCTSTSPCRTWICGRMCARAGQSCLRLPGPEPYLYARHAPHRTQDPHQFYVYSRPAPYQCITTPQLERRPELSTSTWSQTVLLRKTYIPQPAWHTEVRQGGCEGPSPGQQCCL